MGQLVHRTLGGGGEEGGGGDVEHICTYNYEWNMIILVHTYICVENMVHAHITTVHANTCST